ncbi:MAG: hypothetical protein MSG64_15040 [Pyrinomonadaceae bacterium MAG19_C2-C3]|nr:hypothetical protein [Pyrinomonadaceae bacterium MAG19_C2-C3]
MLRRLLVITLAIAFLAFSFFHSWSGESQTKQPQTARQRIDELLPKQIPAINAKPDLPGTIDGATNPNAIPDSVAYELLFRTLAERPAQGLLAEAGFTYDQIDLLLRAADSSVPLGNYDDTARALKKSRPLTADELMKLSALQQQKTEYIKRLQVFVVDWFTQYKAIDKLERFIKDEVKAKTKRIDRSSLQASSKAARQRQSGNNGKASFVKTSAKSSRAATQSGGNIYLYGNAWIDGGFVAGSGTISEDYTGSTTYMVTTTIRSPDDSRAATSQAGYSYATVVNTNQLPIMPNDGTFTVESVFEAQEDAGGYYDEYGNWVSYGTYNYYVGSVTKGQVVQPQIRLERAVFDRPIVPIRNGETVLSVSVQTTQGIPSGTTATLELNFGTNQGNVVYSIIPASRNYTAFPLTGNGQTDVRTFTHRTDLNNTGTGTVFETVFLGRPASIPVPDGTPIPIGGMPLMLDVSFMVPTPTPTPSPSPTPTPTTIASGSCYGAGTGSYCFQVSGACSPGTVNFGSSGPTTSCCCYWSPIMIDVEGDGYHLTDAANGVGFDPGGTGTRYQVAWMAEGSDEAWLVLDRNNNGIVDNGLELFGNFTDQPPSSEANGFLALAMFDKSDKGGNNDGEIDGQDAVFQRLRLWQDGNHNAVSELNEFSTPMEKGITAFRLNYKDSKRVDAFGNKFRYRAKIRSTSGAPVGRWAWDIFPVVGSAIN